MKTKITAIFTALAIVIGLLTLTGCADTRNAMSINGIEIRAGEYIWAQITAAHEAANMFRAANPDVNTGDTNFSFFEQQLEGRNFTDWVNDRAIEICKERIALALIFDEMGLEFPVGYERDVAELVNLNWDNAGEMNPALGYDTWGEFYASVGIGRESLAAIITYDEMRGVIFEAHFGAGGTMEVPRSEIEAHFASTYMLFRLIEIPITAEQTEEEILANMALANGYADRLNAGESFTRIQDEYRAILQAEDEQLTINNEQLTIIDENEEAEEIGGVEEAEEIEEIEEINETDETDEITETVVPHHEHEHEHEEIDETVNDILERVGTPMYPWEAGAFEFLSALGLNTAGVFRGETTITLFQRRDILEREDLIEDGTAILLAEMKGDEMDDIINSRAATLNVVLNEAAISRYRLTRSVPRVLLV
jgi:PAS domain-containing protein